MTTDVAFASAALACAFVATVLAVWSWFVGGRDAAAALMPLSATLLWYSVASSQDVVALWLASLAYVVSCAALFVMRVLASRVTPEGRRGDVAAVVLAVLRVLSVTALVDLVILAGLALVERVLPFYSSLLV